MAKNTCPRCGHAMSYVKMKGRPAMWECSNCGNQEWAPEPDEEEAPDDDK